VGGLTDDERAEEGHEPQGDLGLALLPDHVELGEVRHLAHLVRVRVRARARGWG
tara:strand:+ start:460 stop:621 length:162 start_codon:yes stop_codon:yes gene_type:complete